MKRTLLLALCCAILVTFGGLKARADDDDDNGLKWKGKHPIAVLKGVFAADNGMSGPGAMKGEATLWVKNMSDVTVDGVVIDLELYNGNNGRKVETVTRKVGEMAAGDKKYILFKWEVYGAQTLKPRVWVYYNGGGEDPVKFDGEPPIWSGQ